MPTTLFTIEILTLYKKLQAMMANHDGLLSYPRSNICPDSPPLSDRGMPAVVKFRSEPSTLITSYTFDSPRTRLGYSTLVSPRPSLLVLQTFPGKHLLLLQIIYIPGAAGFSSWPPTQSPRQEKLVSRLQTVYVATSLY